MKISSVKGFHDVLPDESARWNRMEAEAREVFSRYGYDEIRIPIVERTELFSRSIGEATDIVEKEMYTFEDRDGSSVTLRPEGTASVVRAYVEHAVHQREPFSKLYYIGPMFRRERPQKGRLRQFHQIGVEAIGRDDAAVDAEVVLLLHDLISALKVRDPRIELNSLGCSICRPRYVEVLRRFGEQHIDELCENCKRRLERNPMRLLDCKVESCQVATADAPKISDHLCEACREHFQTVRTLLAREQIETHLNPRMVRGLDYYCRTAFEVSAAGLGAQSAVGGGGRYDGLVRSFGGPDAAGVGFALGVERLLLAMAEDGSPMRRPPEIFLAPLDRAAESEATHLAHSLRRDGMRVEVPSAGKSLKSQMRSADRLGAPYVLILGAEELAANAVTVRDMAGKRNFPLAITLPTTAADLRAALVRLSAEPPVEQHP
jgi:histidyl-tRNA synthetase